MLVFARRRGEAIVIDGNIKITVVEIRSGKVRLGIEAPDHIPVNRGEIQRALEATGRTQIRSRQSA